MKTCRKCGVLFDSTNCKQCDRDRKRKLRETNRAAFNEGIRIWREANPARANEIAKKWRDKYPERVREVNRKQRAKNRDKYIADSKKYYQENAERLKLARKEYISKNRQKIRILNQNRRERARINGGKLSHGLSEKLFKLQRGRCAVCHQSILDRERMDHVIPLALGGPNEDWNIQLLCPPCNGKKRSKHPIDFMQERGFLL